MAHADQLRRPLTLAPLEAATRFVTQYPVGPGLFGNMAMTEEHYAVVFAAMPDVLVKRLLSPLHNPFDGQYPPSAPQIAKWARDEAERHETAIRTAEALAERPWWGVRDEAEILLTAPAAARHAFADEARAKKLFGVGAEKYAAWRWSDPEVRAAYAPPTPEADEARKAAVAERLARVQAELEESDKRIKAEPGDGRPREDAPGAAAIRAAMQKTVEKGSW